MHFSRMTKRTHEQLVAADWLCSTERSALAEVISGDISNLPLSTAGCGTTNWTTRGDRVTVETHGGNRILEGDASKVQEPRASGGVGLCSRGAARNGPSITLVDGAGAGGARNGSSRDEEDEEGNGKKNDFREHFSSECGCG